MIYLMAFVVGLVAGYMIGALVVMHDWRTSGAKYGYWEDEEGE